MSSRRETDRRRAEPRAHRAEARTSCPVTTLPRVRSEAVRRPRDHISSLHSMIDRVIRASCAAERVYDHVRCAVRGCVLHLQLRCELYMIREYPYVAQIQYRFN